LAVLNEIQHLSVQFQHLLHPSWLLRPFQCTNEDGISKEAPRKKSFAGTETAKAVHQYLVLGNRKEISKVVYILQADFFEKWSHFNLGGMVLGEHQILTFGQMSMIWDDCASELNNTTAPLLEDTISSTFYGVNSCLSLINLTPSLHFFAIVDVVEAEVERWYLLVVGFHDLQGWKAHTDGPRSKIHTRRSDGEVGMLVVHHLGGRLGHIMVSGHGSGGKMAQSKGKVIGSRNDVAVPKMKGTLLQNNGVLFVTNAHAKDDGVLVCVVARFCTTGSTT